MFLLPKLDEVSARFRDDVEGTREFLLDRGIPAGSMMALTHFSARLAIDPSFRRDITSIVQGVIQRENEAVDYMDLLAILVVAAAGAGPIAANNEQEEFVREILRFLTHVRQPVDVVAPVFVRSRNVIPFVANAEPLIEDRSPQPVCDRNDAAFSPVSSTPFSQVEGHGSSRWPGAAVWIAAAMVLAVALGWMIYRKGHATLQTTAVPKTAAPKALPAHDENGEQATVAAGPLRKPQAPLARKPLPAVARNLNAPLPESLTTGRALPVLPVQPLDENRNFPSVKTTPSARPSVIAESNPVSAPFKADPKDAMKSTPLVNTATATTPFVRRRLPKVVVINEEPRRPGDWTRNLNAAAPGVVHPASIGMMASNLISSPAPAYPAAAFRARVEGAVMVRAVVDRDGNVIDAHVVSGPELLRNVSLEAVQHWHYRPYMQGGKPVEVATTAVLDFELP